MCGTEAQVPAWVETLSALLAPTIAILAMAIGLWQARTARLKLRLDLFDKRYAAYDAIQHLIGKRLARGKLKLEDEVEFLEGVDRAKMLFRAKDAAVVTDAWSRVSRLDALEATYPSDDGPERTAHAGKVILAQEELRALLNALPTRFRPYLDFTNP